MLSHVIKRLENALKAGCALSATQCRILYSLAVHGGAQQVGEVSSALGLRPSTTTAALAELERRELLIRQGCSEDFRVVHIVATEAGLAMAATVSQVVIYGLRACFGPLDGNPQKETGYSRIYRRVLGGEDAFVSAFMLWQHYYAARSPMERHAKAEGLALADYRVLLEVGQYNAGVTPGDLAVALMLKAVEVSSSTKALAQRGLVRRTRNRSDRRSILVDITSDGFALLDRTATAICDETFQKSLAKTRSDLQAIQELSLHFNAQARKHFTPAWPKPAST